MEGQMTSLKKVFYGEGRKINFNKMQKQEEISWEREKKILVIHSKNLEKRNQPNQCEICAVCSQQKIIHSFSSYTGFKQRG